MDLDLRVRMNRVGVRECERARVRNVKDGRPRKKDSSRQERREGKEE